jgi:hypothetical protein
MMAHASLYWSSVSIERQYARQSAADCGSVAAVVSDFIGSIPVRGVERPAVREPLPGIIRSPSSRAHLLLGHMLVCVFQGSGTSFASTIISGVVAALIPHIAGNVWAA